MTTLRLALLTTLHAVFSTVQLQLPFSLTRSIVISATESGKSREGWPFIDALPDDGLCETPASATLPIGLHYCKRYGLGPYFLSKYRIKKNIMDCDKSLLKPPPVNVYPKYDYWVDPPKADLSDAQTYKENPRPLSTQQARREAFMLCHLTSAFNEAFRFFKSTSCSTPNLNETYTIPQDPTNY